MARAKLELDPDSEEPSDESEEKETEPVRDMASKVQSSDLSSHK